MNLELKRPLVFIKCFTTGKDYKEDRIFKISIRKIFPDLTEKTGTRLFNPEKELSEFAIKNYNASKEELSDKPTFSSVSNKVFDFINDSDICGFNIHSDIYFLFAEFERSGIQFDCLNRKILDLDVMYKKLNPRNFEDAVLKYIGLNINNEIKPSTEEYVVMYDKMLKGMCETHLNDPVKKVKGEQLIINSNFDNLVGCFEDENNKLDLKGYIIKDIDGNLILNYGKKYKGAYLDYIFSSDYEYIEWLINKSEELPFDAKNILRFFVKNKKYKEANA